MFKRKEDLECASKRRGACTCLSADHWTAKVWTLTCAAMNTLSHADSCVDLLQLIDLGNVIVPSMLELYSATADELLTRASSTLYGRASGGEDTDGEDHEPVANGDVRDGVHIASLSYRAPEVLTCLLPFSAALDMWALGATLVEVCAAALIPSLAWRPLREPLCCLPLRFARVNVCFRHPTTCCK
jgi:serine/threonine protein kinase